MISTIFSTVSAGLSAFFTKAKIYLIIGVAVVVVGLLVWVMVERGKNSALKNKVQTLENKNEVLNRDIEFSNARDYILDNFENSTGVIKVITNVVVLDDFKQGAVDAIIEDYYK